MILLDANVLLYAHVTQFRQHERARSWLDDGLVPDAHLARDRARLMLCSIDADFARFSELRWHNPLSDCAGSG